MKSRWIRQVLKKKILLYSLLLLVSVFIAIGVPATFGLHNLGANHESSIFSWSTCAAIVFLIGSAAAITIHQRTQVIRAEKQRRHTECAFRKTQEDLGSLLTRPDGSHSPATATQLSELSHYIYQDAKAGEVELIRELNHIKIYIELQKRSLSEPATIKYSAPVHTGKKKIAPLLLLSIIDHAFRNGITPGRASSIHIEVSVDQHRLYLSARSNRSGDPQKEEAGNAILANTRERLQNLYPGRHVLEATEDADQSTVNLMIELS